MPLLVIPEICRPLARPYSAANPCVTTFTSAIASTLVCSIWPLLPVSMIDTPSIWKLFWPPPPSRDVPTTPGASDARLAKLRLATGRFCTAWVVTVNDRSPLRACTSGAESAETTTVSESVPSSSSRLPTLTRSPALTGMPLRSSALKPSSVMRTV